MRFKSALRVVGGVVIVVGLSACGPKEITREVEYTGDESKAMEVVQEAAAAAEAETAGEPSSMAIDFDAPREIASDGSEVTDLELLNQALEAARNLPSTTAGTGKAKTMEEEMNETWVPGDDITSVEDLVKKGLIKSVPEPPAGKKYVLENGVIVLK